MSFQYHVESDSDELERKLNSTLQEFNKNMNNGYRSDSNDSLDSEDSLDDNNEILLARLNNKLDLESSHLYDFSNKLSNFKQELKTLKHESMSRNSVLPEILLKYFTNDRRIRMLVHQIHYNTWRIEMDKKNRKLESARYYL